MKKIILSLCFISSVSLLNAQNINFGAKVGANLSSISFSDSDYSTSSKVGFHIGGFVNYAFDEKLALQPELFYTTGGNTWTVSSTDGEVKTTEIAIPILVQYQVAENIHVEAGPQYNFLLSIEQAINDGDFDDIKEFYKSGYLGLALGAGYNLETLLPGLKAGLRYTFGLSEINDEEVGAGDLKASALQLSFQYTFSK